MTPLFFFGSDRYAQVVLDQLRLQPDLQITHFTDLSNIPTITTDTIGLVASFPHLFPSEIISQFNDHLYNLHPSLLPQYRNVAPVPYALAMGDPVTGITLQRIDEKIDHGQILAQLEESILSSDTSPILLDRLFNKGTDLFVRWLADQPTNRPTESPNRWRADQLIFTRKLTGNSGHLEWPLVLKLINNQPITPADTTNILINLRLTRSSTINHRSSTILSDLIRALTGYEKVWTISPTKKGDLRVEIVSADPILVKIAGKPHPISYTDFQKYYL